MEISKVKLPRVPNRGQCELSLNRCLEPFQGKEMDGGHYWCDVPDYNKGTWRRCDDENLSELSGYPDSVWY